MEKVRVVQKPTQKYVSKNTLIEVPDFYPRGDKKRRLKESYPRERERLGIKRPGTASRTLSE